MTKRKLALLIIDSVIILFVAFATSVLFPEISSFSIQNENMILKVAVMTVCILLFRILMKIYASIWRYLSIRPYIKLMVSDACACVVFFSLGRIFPVLNTGFSYAVVSESLILLVTLASRFLYQALHARINSYKEAPSGSQNKINIAIVGAGNVGATLAEELLRNPRTHYNPYCFIDNDKSKVYNNIHGIKIYPESESTVQLLKTFPVQEIVVALPDANRETRTKIYDRYKETGCKVKIYDYPLENSMEVSGRRTIREFNIEDILFRDVIELNDTSTRELYQNKVILVTGGGGSIGSELCRQAAKCQPKKLIILDIYENNAYEIQQDLVRQYGNDLDLEVVIASVRDYDRIDSVFERYRPDIVFHAAAHKHVPLMEYSPGEAIKNNVFGTYNVANAAEKYGVDKFILISTDKAVNPTNVMGASKRLCEMIVQSRLDSKTDFMAVRFGNVLGSNGSVIPLFKQQIAAGGPITLTDKRVIRYFMTIPEAVSLVMETGVMAKGGELFVLDMGKPVKILDLAERMIQLSGLTPYEDIDIEEIGLRPGEKLYEELLIKTEELDKTENDVIFVERDKPLSKIEIDAKLSILKQALKTDSVDAIVRAVRDTVPTYKDPNEVNSNAEQAGEMKMARMKAEAVC